MTTYHGPPVGAVENRIQNAIDARSFYQFKRLIARKGWTAAQLRCEVPLSDELQALIEDMGLIRYEDYVSRLP